VTAETGGMNFKGKVVVATGVGAGIGAAIADAFAARGATVVGLERDPEALRQTAMRIGASGGSLHPICADVSAEQDVAEAFREIVAEFSNIDVLVNNVGREFYRNFVDVSVSDFDRQVAVNLRSVFLCCSHVVPLMIREQRGCIINTASVQALATTGQTAPYAAAKAGILGMTRDMARDLGQYNIRVNGICPGCIATPMMDRGLGRSPDPQAAREVMRSAIPLRRLGEPREIANVVLFLASDLASYVSGVAMVIDGGLLAQLPVV
jgi:meso-butanediol dehydrogenase/(S,S)-butanediol dehydrogenase/diacetyl reductase